MREATGKTVHASRMAGFFFSGRGRGFLVALVAAPVMTVLAPLGTGAVPGLPRFAYWLLLMLAGAALGLGASLLVERWGRLKRRPLIEGLAVAVLMALPLTILVALASHLFFGRGTLGLRGSIILYGIVLMIAAVLSTITVLFERQASGAGMPPPDAAAEARARFAERLPLPMRRHAILALEAEDHYLRVHLAGGHSVLILLRLGDAIAELAAVPGARTHRSWWVARDAVTRIARADGRAVLTLDGGTEVPVSRTYYRALAEAGWLI
jgi:hypothetical protein